MTRQLYIDGDFQEPPFETDQRYYTVTPIPFSGRHEREVLATVEPPIKCADGSFSRVRLQARGERIRDEIGKVIFGEQKVAPVFISSAEDVGAEFHIRVTSISDHVLEVWKHGGYWQWFVDAIEAYAAREGNVDVPEAHIEDGLKLGGYVAGLRQRREDGTLSSKEEEFLNNLPGWRW